MGVCCTTEKKPKTAIAAEKREQKKISLRGALNTRNQAVDFDDKLELILTPGSNEDPQQLKTLINTNKFNINNYLEKNDNDTILTKAIGLVSSPEMVKAILDMGANVNLTEKSSGHSPLILACLNLDKNVVELILSKSPSLEAGNSDDNEKNKNIIEYLDEKINSTQWKNKKDYQEIREILINYQNSINDRQ